MYGSSNSLDSFRPPAQKSPKRALPNHPGACALHALSFFRSIAGAKQRYASLAKSNPNIGKSLGTHLATVPLKNGDGVMDPDAGDHVDLHEYIGVSWANRAHSIEALPLYGGAP